MKLFGFEFFAKEPRWEVESKDINKDSISFDERGWVDPKYAYEDIRRIG